MTGPGGAAPAGARIVHASAVALDGRAVLILGPSGSGKSSLALALMASGCTLVSDDRTVLSERDGVLLAAPPPSIAGRIEARGLGILAADWAGPMPVVLAVDLTPDHISPRLPAPEVFRCAAAEVPLVRAAMSAHLSAAVRQYLKGGRVA